MRIERTREIVRNAEHRERSSSSGLLGRGDLRRLPGESNNRLDLQGWQEYI